MRQKRCACTIGYILFIAQLVGVSLVLCHPPAAAAEPGEVLRVGIRDVRPFVFLEKEHPPIGYSIDLWKAVAGELGLEYRFVPGSGIGETLEQMRDGMLDLAIGAITITEEREQQFDFSFAHFHSGLGIMTSSSGGKPVVADFFLSFFTRDRQLQVGGFLLFLLMSAHGIWLVERRKDQLFHKNYFPGILEGIYWSIVTASTVGYGDYVPKSRTGKLLSILVIIISLPLFAVFVADISSFFTLYKLESNIKGPQDLAGKVIGAVEGSTSEDYLTGANLTISGYYPNSTEMFADLDRGELEAVVHDLPTLHYHAGTKGKGKVKIVGKMFDRQDYGFLLPEGSPLKEPIDRALLRLLENGTIGAIHDKWFAVGERQR